MCGRAGPDGELAGVLPSEDGRRRQVRAGGLEPPSPCYAGQGVRLEGPVTCGLFVPVMTAHVRRGPAGPDAVRTQHGPAELIGCARPGDQSQSGGVLAMVGGASGGA